MIGFTLLLFLSTTFPVTSAYPTGLGDSFSSGSMAFACTYLFFFLLQAAHCLVVIVRMRGHRLPYLTLFLAIAVTIVALIAMIAAIITFTTPVYTLIVFTRNWSAILIFIGIMTFLRDHETMICGNPNGTQRNIAHMVVHVVFAVLMFIFATARASALVHLKHAIDKNPSMLKAEYYRRINTADTLNYISVALCTLSAVDVLITATLLSRTAKSRGISDKVTHAVLYVISPLYALFTLSRFAFVIIFSLVRSSSPASLRVVNLARDVILYLLTLIIFGILLFLSTNRSSWDFWSTIPVSTTKQGQQLYPPQPYESQPYGTQPPSPQPHLRRNASGQGPQIDLPH